jgi:phosphoribosylformylglycinamidine cyclo-ligase
MSEAYRRAGVDLEANARAVELIRDIASGARTPEVADDIGGFAGLYRLGAGRLLAAGTDGVGTKTEVARMAGRLDTIGIDLVAMSANDVACTGAKPIFFLDCVVVGRLDPEPVASIVSGVAEGCRRAGCALLGGETAEHPGLLEPDAFDLTGTCVGLVEENLLLGPSRVREGDALIGLTSSGPHSNGYSLIRSAVGHMYLDVVPNGFSRTLGEELLEPTAIYAPLMANLASDGLISSAAHITGGGLYGNLPRALPAGLGADIETGSWPEPAIFRLIQEEAGASDADMFATFNMGIGMVLVVPVQNTEAVLARALSSGIAGSVIGSVKKGHGVGGLVQG